MIIIYSELEYVFRPTHNYNRSSLSALVSENDSVGFTVWFGIEKQAVSNFEVLYHFYNIKLTQPPTQQLSYKKHFENNPTLHTNINIV